MVRARVWFRAVAVLVALGVFVLVAGLLFAVVLAGIWGLVVFCLVYTRKVEEDESGVRSFRYNLCAVGVLYLIPIGVAATFFVLVSRYIFWRGDSLSIESLVDMQKLFENVSRFFSENLKLNESTVLVVLVAIYLLSCALLSKGNQRKRGPVVTATSAPRLRFRERTVIARHRTVTTYIKYTGPISVGLATLASLTLFGMQLGETTEDLQLRVKVLQEGYADATKRIEAALTERVTGALYEDIREALPATYRAAYLLPTQIDDLVADVRHHADRAKSQGVTVPDVERTLQEETDRIRKVDALAAHGPDLRIDGIGRQTVPHGTTQKEVNAARNTLNSLRDAAAIDLITEGPRNFTLQIEKLDTERLVTLTESLTQAIPILEPLMQAVVEVADKTLQERIEKAYDRAVQVAMYNPGELEAFIEREARAMVTETNTKTLAENAAPQAQQKSQELRQTLSLLAASKALIDKAVAEHSAGQPTPDARQSTPDARQPTPDARQPKPDPQRSRNILKPRPRPETYRHPLVDKDGYHHPLVDKNGYHHPLLDNHR